MADDPENQRKFAEDAAAAFGGDAGDAYADAGAGAQNADFKMPSVDEVWKVIEQMKDISDEEKETLRQNLFNPQDLSSEEFLKRMTHDQRPTLSSGDYLIFITMISIIALVFALFGYKLYKSLKAKELKKQEKLKQKQSKKSKKAN